MKYMWPALVALLFANVLWCGYGIYKNWPVPDSGPPRIESWKSDGSFGGGSLYYSSNAKPGTYLPICFEQACLDSGGSSRSDWTMECGGVRPEGDQCVKNMTERQQAEKKRDSSTAWMDNTCYSGHEDCEKQFEKRYKAWVADRQQAEMKNHPDRFMTECRSADPRYCDKLLQEKIKASIARDAVENSRIVYRKSITKRTISSSPPPPQP